MAQRAYAPLPSPPNPNPKKWKGDNDRWKKPYRPGPRPKYPFGKKPPLPVPFLPIRQPLQYARLLGRLAGPVGWLLLAYDIYQLYQWYRGEPEIVVPPGWTCHQACTSLGGPTEIEGAVEPAGFGCGAGSCQEGYLHNSVSFPFAAGSNRIRLWYSEIFQPNPAYRYVDATDIYEYPLGEAPAYEDFWQAPSFVAPPVVPASPSAFLDPNNLPIMQPVPALRPLPPMVPQPNWWRHPGDPSPIIPDGPWPTPIHPRYPPLPGEMWPSPSNAPSVSPAPWLPIEPIGPVSPWAPPLVPKPVEPLPRPRPWFPAPQLPLPEVPPVPWEPTRPWERPVWGLVPSPDPRAPQPRPEPGTHATRPPKTGDKEAKKRSPAAGLLWWAANAATESTDYIKAAYNALPWKARRFKGRDGKWRDRDITQQDRLRRIYKHIEDLDVYEFAKNVAVNNAQDFALGKISKQVQKLNGLLAEYGYARPAGIETGPAL